MVEVLYTTHKHGTNSNYLRVRTEQELESWQTTEREREKDRVRESEREIERGRERTRKQENK